MSQQNYDTSNIREKFLTSTLIFFLLKIYIEVCINEWKYALNTNNDYDAFLTIIEFHDIQWIILHEIVVLMNFYTNSRKEINFLKWWLWKDNKIFEQRNENNFTIKKIKKS